MFTTLWLKTKSKFPPVSVNPTSKSCTTELLYHSHPPSKTPVSSDICCLSSCQIRICQCHGWTSPLHCWYPLWFLTENPIALNECQSVEFLAIHKVTSLNVNRQGKNNEGEFFIEQGEVDRQRREHAARIPHKNVSPVPCWSVDLPKMMQGILKCM